MDNNDLIFGDIAVKMVTDARFNVFVADFAHKFIEHQDWREGQTLYNTYWEWFPDKADQLRLSDANPYYEDSNVNKAWGFIITNWE